MIEIKNLTKAYGGHTVLNRLNLKVDSEEIVALLGPSGEGKSTFIRCVSGLESFSEGQISFGGDLGIVFQGFHLFPHMTVLRNLIYAPLCKKKMDLAKATAKARDLLCRTGLSHRENYYPKTLSGGEKQRVAILRALMMKPKVLILDEPSSALDRERTIELATLLKSLTQQGITLLVVTHDLELARDLGARILILKQGKLVSSPFEENDLGDVQQKEVTSNHT